MIVMTPLQLKLFELTLAQITESVSRLQNIREFNDEQCQILIDSALNTTKALDQRLAEHRP